MEHNILIDNALIKAVDENQNLQALLNGLAISGAIASILLGLAYHREIRRLQGGGRLGVPATTNTSR